MCELLGMSANVPTDICFSFTGLIRRGGDTGPHGDGWGIAFFEGKGLRAFHDPHASANSEIANLLQNHPIKSHVVISHIRQANVGDISLVNTHPFTRELWGRYWTFAHNGQINGFSGRTTHYRPVGNTDSEALFCDLLNRVRDELDEQAPLAQLTDILVDACCHYAGQGVSNVMLSNGDWLFTYCSTKLACITRRAPFGPARLKDADMTVDFAAETTPDDIVSVIATEPLTSNEHWTLYRPGDWKLWQAGEVTLAGHAL
jgi:predicted glutamine amidotransferase